MKFTKMITTTLAVGILATGVATSGLNNNAEAAKANHNVTQNILNFTDVPYTTTVNGITSLALSDFEFFKGQQVSTLELNKVVKDALRQDRGINAYKLKKAKRATYTITFKKGNKLTVNLKSSRYQLNLINTSDIKKIDINVNVRTR